MATCFSCRIDLPESARFCLSCGLPQDKSIRTKVAEAQREIERERKFVCILFGDLSGFTSLSEKLDPEAVTELMSAAFQRLGAIVIQHDGYIDKFMGDCIMALFGAPFAHEDDPQRAVACALAMQSELEAFNRERKLNLKMRIGINSGIVVAGGIGAEGKFEYTVMGDAVNIAQRVQTAAKPGETLITQNVSRLAERAFELKELPAIQAKGKSTPIPVFAVHAARLNQLPKESIHQGYSKLAGRGLEIQILEEALTSAKTSKGQALILQGEAGLGKSRLIHELKKRALGEDFLWLEAPCNGITRETPFSTFIRLAKNLKTLGFLENLFDAEEKLLLEEITRLENPPIQGHQAFDRKQTYFEFFKKILFQTLNNKPAVIVIEDMHWMDAISKELLIQIQEDCKTLPMLIVGASREPQSEFRVIGLHPLSVDDCRAIVRSLLRIDTVPESIWELVQSKADGNPLYVEELLKSLIDSKTLVFQNEHWELVQSPDSEAVPQTLQALIASRIDRLPKQEKQILQLASVIGRSFSDRLLQQAGNFGEEIFEALRHLRRRELIFEFATDGEKIVYIFKHALTQDVTYESLLIKRRKEYHAAVAKCLEADKEIREDKLELLAHHFLRAGNRPKAIDYLSLCSMKSAAAYDNERAVKFLKSAIQVMEEDYAETKQIDPRIFELLIRLEDIYDIQGEFDEAELIILRQVFLSQSHELWNPLAQAYRRLGEIARFRGQYDLSLDWLNKSLAVTRQHHESVSEILTLKVMGATLFHKGDSAAAIKLYEEALSKVSQTKNIKLESEISNDIGVAYFQLQDYSRAEYFLDRCEKICSNADEMSKQRVAVLINLGLTLNFKGDQVSAIAQTQRAAELAQKIGFRTLQITALQNLGRLLMIVKRPEEAAAEFRRSIEVATKIANHSAKLNGRANLAGALKSLSKLDEAKSLLEEVRTEAIERNIWTEFWHASEILTEIYLQEGSADDALQFLETVQMRLENHGPQELVIRCRNTREKIASNQIR